MEVFEGRSVLGGIAIGKIRIHNKAKFKVDKVKVTDTKLQIERYKKAQEEAKRQLEELYEKALKEVGENSASIFLVHQMMLEDEDYVGSIENIINSQEVNAEYAIAATSENFSKMFASMDDEYMRGRAYDVKDISDKLLSILNEKKATNAVKASDDEDFFILLANDLAPSETVQLDKNKVLAFVTRHGSTNSHTAILARTMGIPALIGAKIEKSRMDEFEGMLAIVDGYNGKIIINPDADTLKQMEERKQKEQEEKELLLSLKGKKDITRDGKEIKLYANIGNIQDLALVLKNDAAGIGLFRSEFIYLESEDFPTEDEQFDIYKTVAENMAGRPIIIRTLDIGADKQAGYFNLEDEENPALGYRAIRICLGNLNIFKTQLRAILKASAYGDISIMYPMITSVWEVKKIKETMEEVKRELNSQGVEFKNISQGIMIETPAAAMISDELAPLVDFFSIGTNDLTQYTLAIDRQNTKLEDFYDAHHLAVIRMISNVVENAHKAGIWVGICGELGADLSLTEEFLRMGVDELSVSPSRILPTRKKILETSIDKTCII